MQKTGRSDTVSQATPAGAEYVPMEDAAKALFGGKVRGGAEAARQRMLGRRGLSGGAYMFLVCLRFRLRLRL